MAVTRSAVFCAGVAGERRDELATPVAVSMNAVGRTSASAFQPEYDVNASSLTMVPLQTAVKRLSFDTGLPGFEQDFEHRCRLRRE